MALFSRNSQTNLEWNQAWTTSYFWYCTKEHTLTYPYGTYGAQTGLHLMNSAVFHLGQYFSKSPWTKELLNLIMAYMAQAYMVHRLTRTKWTVHLSTSVEPI